MQVLPLITATTMINYFPLLLHRFFPHIVNNFGSNLSRIDAISLDASFGSGQSFHWAGGLQNPNGFEQSWFPAKYPNLTLVDVLERARRVLPPLSSTVFFVLYLCPFWFKV